MWERRKIGIKRNGIREKAYRSRVTAFSLSVRIEGVLGGEGRIR